MNQGRTNKALLIVSIVFSLVVAGMTILIRWLLGDIVGIDFFASGGHLNVFLHVGIATTLTMAFVMTMIMKAVKKLGSNFGPIPK